MGKLRLAIFLLILAANALACLMYLQPRGYFLLDTTGHRVNRQSDDKNNEVPSGSVRREIHSIASTNASMRQTSSYSTTLASPTLPSKQKRIPPSPSRRLTHPYEYLINREDLCLKSAGNKLLLLIAVCSAVQNLRERQAIRETWGSACSKTGNTGPVRIVFLLGASNNSDITDKLKAEADKYGDIVQETFVDSYQNLTHKSVMMLKWASNYCPNVQFVLKTDDDMYINVANLVRTASRLGNKKNLMFGVLFRRAHPERNASAKWYVPESQYAAKWFPDYLSGTAYAMTFDVVPKLYEASLKKPFLIMEDVFVTGICASFAGVKRIAVKGFHHYKLPSNGCAFRDSITGHHVNVQEMRKIWRELRNGSLPCRRVLQKKT